MSMALRGRTSKAEVYQLWDKTDVLRAVALRCRAKLDGPETYRKNRCERPSQEKCHGQCL